MRAAPTPCAPTAASRSTWATTSATTTSTSSSRHGPGTATTAPPGNDDLGSLSAWYVFAALGFGPVTPGAPFHVLGSPAFTKATIALPRGRKLVIEAPGASAAAKYVTGARLDGRPLGRAWVEEAKLRRGATLRLDMAATPDEAFGAQNRPPSASDSDLTRFGCQV